MNDLVLLRRSLGVGVSMVILGLLMLVLTIATLGHSHFCGSGFLLLASIAMLLIGVYAMLDRRHHISISESGLWVRSLGSGEISWTQIVSAKLKWLPRSGNFITITLNSGATHTFFAEGFQMSSQDLLRMINERIDAVRNTKSMANE